MSRSDPNARSFRPGKIEDAIWGLALKGQTGKRRGGAFGNPTAAGKSRLSWNDSGCKTPAGRPGTAAPSTGKEVRQGCRPPSRFFPRPRTSLRRIAPTRARVQTGSAGRSPCSQFGPRSCAGHSDPEPPPVELQLSQCQAAIQIEFGRVGGKGREMHDLFPTLLGIQSAYGCPAIGIGRRLLRKCARGQTEAQEQGGYSCCLGRASKVHWPAAFQLFSKSARSNLNSLRCAGSLTSTKSCCQSRPVTTT